MLLKTQRWFSNLQFVWWVLGEKLCAVNRRKKELVFFKETRVMASCALLRASAHGSASSSSRCSITFCPDATASAFYHPVCLNPVVKRQSPGVVKWVPPECLHVRGAAAARRPTLKRVETVDINRFVLFWSADL